MPNKTVQDADGAFCGNCGAAIAVDDRFCGGCGSPQEGYATATDTRDSFPGTLDEDIQDLTIVDPPFTTADPDAGSGRAASKPIGFWDAAGIAMELVVRGVYIVLCAGVAILAFQNGSPLVGAGAIAYGLYILGGGKWFIY